LNFVNDFLGLNGFAGINITQSEVSALPDAQGDNFFGFINLPNPSVFTIDIVSLPTHLSASNSTNIINRATPVSPPV